MAARFGDPFRPLEPECKVVQFSEPLPDDDLRRAGELLRERPDVELYIYGRAGRDLDFLRHFAGLRRLHLSLYELDDIAGFAHVADGLEELNFGGTKLDFGQFKRRGRERLSCAARYCVEFLWCLGWAWT